MPEVTATAITIDDGKAEIITDIAKVTTDKSVQDFVAGKVASCADAKCTYDANGGWMTLSDKSMFHEVDREIVKKYDLCKQLRPDLVKPPYDSFYYLTDGVTKKLCTHDEMLAVIAAQEVQNDR